MTTILLAWPDVKSMLVKSGDLKTVKVMPLDSFSSFDLMTKVPSSVFVLGKTRPVSSAVSTSQVTLFTSIEVGTMLTFFEL